MSIGPDLVNFCLLAEGFPLDICPAEVVGFFNDKTKAPVNGIASISSKWLLHLRSHDDQIRCLRNHRIFDISHRNENYKITLIYPEVTSASSSVNWVTVMEDQQGQGHSVTPESRLSDGNRNPVGASMWEEPGAPGTSHPHSQQTSSQPHPGIPQSMMRGHEPYVQASPSIEQRPLFPPSQNTPFLPAGANAGVEPGRLPPYPGSQAMEWSILGEPMFEDEPKLGQPYPVNHGAAATPGMQQGQNYNAPSYPDFRPVQVMFPSQAREKTPTLAHQMEDLNLKHEPFPYYPSTDQESMDTYNPRTTTDMGGVQDNFFHSESSEKDWSIQHPDFYLLVTELPPSITESELREFFEDRRQSGGGPTTKVDLNTSAQSAAVFFSDVEVIQRVLQKSPLLLKNKMIQVKRSSTAKAERTEPEIQTVEIRGLQSEAEVEMCTYYFENPSKGGGDIESHDWNEEEKIFFITFKDPEVAKKVTEKGHTIAGKVLEVSLYSPPPEEPDDSPPPCTIEVRGFDPAKREMYEFYFSNPNKGGGTIVNLSLSEDETVMLITFETPEVAQRVAEKPHTVSGKQLDVVLAPVEDTTPSSTVLVLGCDLENTEVYRYYFENPNKGGGEIVDFVVDKEQQAIRITFENPEVAEAVVAREHCVGGRSLETSLYKPKKTSAKRQKSQEPPEAEEEEPPLRTVVVSVGQGPLNSEDIYIFYFENPRSGGGDVESVTIDKENQLVYITFEDPAVAERVTNKAHTIVGHKVEVTLYVPPKPKPTYQDKLVFRNVANSTSRDCLVMYLERICGLEPVDILYGDEVDTVLVTFPQEPDFSQTLEMARKRPLEGRHLTVSKVPISSCLLVENLADQTTEDTIQLYFENKRSRGGPVEKVELVSSDNKCFVHFESHEVLDGVLRQEHKLDDQTLKVSRYLECLGQSGGSGDPTAFTMPKPLILNNLDRFRVAFVRQSDTTKSAFLQELSSKHAEGKFEGDNLIITCTLTPAVSKARILARTWSADVQETVTSFLGLLEVKKHKVMQQLWKEVEGAVREAGIKCSDGATLFPVSEDTTYVVVGMKSMAEELYHHVSTIITDKEKEIERRKQEITETIPNIDESKLSLLLAVAFDKEEEKRHKGLKMEIQKKKKCIVFHGMINDVKDTQVRMYQKLDTVKTLKITNMTDLQKKVLDAKETKPYIVQKFRSDHICAVWEVIQQGDIILFAFDDKSLVQASHIITKSVVEHVCQLSPESTELLRHQDWQRLVSQFCKANPGVLHIAPAHDGQQIFVTSTDNILHRIVEEVEKFFAENTIYSQTVCFSPSRQKLVKMKWLPHLQHVANKLRAYKVTINMQEAGDKIHTKGTRKGLEEVMKQLEDLNQQIICHREDFEDLSKVKLLSSDCSRDLEMIGGSCQCVLALELEDPQLQVMGSGTLAAASSPQMGGSDLQSAASAQLPNGVTVSVVQGDITQMAVGAIVNAANSSMDHTGGLARDIVQKGGDIIQKESREQMKRKGRPLKEGDVIVSGPGRLQCQTIIHAVGPMYKGGYSGEQDCLFDTVITCLQTANDASLPSIAIPAISTGIFGYPAQESTRVIAEAVKIFFESHRRCTIKSVFLCHLSEDIVTLFAKAVRKTFPSARRSPGFESPAVMRGSYSAAPTYFPSSPRSVAQGVPVKRSSKTVNVSVIAGEIAKQTADVIVNSTSNGLDLQNGAVSSSILKAAGQGLQVECKSKYPGGINTGGVARTKGHGLNCREIFHIALCNFSNPLAQKVLSGVVNTCLTDASNQQYTSLAFPVLGTGNLGFPAPVVAQTMLDAISQFEQRTPATSLTDVRIVVYTTDRKNLQEFQQAQSGMRGDVSGAPLPGARAGGGRQNRRFSEETVSSADAFQKVGGSKGTGASNAEFDIGGLRFVIKQGDITEEDTDAIVNSTNSQVDLSRGGVASALKRKCGPQLERECSQKVDEIVNGGIITTRAYGLKSKIILHLNADHFSRSWEDGIEVCFKEAEVNGVKSIAMPALGTGIGLSPSASASALFNTVVKMYKHGRQQGSLEEVRVVLFDKKIVTSYIQAVQQTGEKHNKANRGFFSSLKSAITGSQNVEVKQTVINPVGEERVSLFIYAEKEAEVMKALKLLDDVAKDKFTRKEIQEEVICTLKQKDIRRIEQIGLKYKAEVKVQTMTGNIVCDGLINQVYDCMQEIQGVLRELDHDQQKKEAAAILANMIRWCYLEVTATGTEQREYEPKENHLIETAFQGKKKEAKIMDSKGTVYIIDFNSMMEYPQIDRTDTVSVMRKDIIKDLAGGQVPESWEKHSANETVKLVDLKSKDKEYQKVAKAFSANVPNVTITNISRVQNQHLYHQYIAKKIHLEKQNPGIENEKTLWHGTSSDAITNINHHGFNRSFCGKNATVYGEGVYFAINANYSASATYSPPDMSGNRYVYQCKVLVGHPTVGQRNLRVLPARSGPILYDSATDNPNSPSMYVIFHDTQAYPEYMITFQ